jgi:hypothetical protein
MPPAVAALNIGVGPCWGETYGDMLEAMARMTPSEPNDAMARIASRRRRTNSLDFNLSSQVNTLPNAKSQAKSKFPREVL